MYLCACNKKIQKIVDGSLSAFRAVYRPLLQQLLEREYVLREQDQAGEYVLEVNGLIIQMT